MKQFKLKVLSLFDGMSAGQMALKILGYSSDDYEYYSSEIENPAIKVTQHNFPNTIQIGDVRNVYFKDGVLHTEKGTFDVGQFDIIIGGSPCTNLSLAGRMKGFATKNNYQVKDLNDYLELKEQNIEFVGESYLFFEYLRLLKECKPTYFFLENVIMDKKNKDLISNLMGVEPIDINSKLVSFQNRRRLYWTNIVDDLVIDDRNVLLKNEYCKTYDKELILTGRGLNKVYKDRNRVVSVDSDKCGCLMKNQERKPTDAIVFKDGDVYRYPTITEAEKMQTFPVGYTNVEGVNYNEKMGMLGNGWTVDVIVEFFKNIKT